MALRNRTDEAPYVARFVDYPSYLFKYGCLISLYIEHFSDARKLIEAHIQSNLTRKNLGRVRVQCILAYQFSRVYIAHLPVDLTVITPEKRRIVGKRGPAPILVVHKRGSELS